MSPVIAAYIFVLVPFGAMAVVALWLEHVDRMKK